jgi:hypothetical protein
MPEENIELTPIEQSRAETGRRYFAVEPDTYIAMSQGVNQIRNYPKGINTIAQTLTGLIPIEKLETANDDSGFVLTSLEVSRFTEADEAMMADPIALGLIIEMTKTEFDALKPLPIEEMEEMEWVDEIEEDII